MRRVLDGFAMAVVLAVLPRVALFAAEAAPFAAPGSGVSTDSGSFLRVLLSLGAVLALLLAGAWLLKRMSFAQGGTQQRIRILAQVSLGARERAVLIRVAGRDVLLGVAPGSVSALFVHDADNAPNGAGIIAGMETATPPAGSARQLPTFRELLRRSLGR